MRDASKKRRSHFTQSCQKQDVPRSSLQDELSFIDLCAVSVYLRCLDDWMTWVDAKSEGWVELLPTLRFYWTTHDLEFQILGIFHLPWTCLYLSVLGKWWNSSVAAVFFDPFLHRRGNMTNDLYRCCDVAAHCDTLTCGHGFTPVWGTQRWVEWFCE